MWPARLFVALGVAAGCSSDGEDPCERARAKLDACDGEIAAAVARGGGFVSFPVTFEGECTGRNRCFSECVGDLDCRELAALIAGSATDPNAEPVGSAGTRCIS